RIAPGISTQDLLLVADVFITDYSSAVFEAAVAEVPSYLLAPDLDEYAQRRDFYIRYPDDLGLPMASSIEELTEMVRRGEADAGMMAALQSFIPPRRTTVAPGVEVAELITSTIHKTRRHDD